MPHQRQRLGKEGEATVTRYLIAKGYRILCQNWHAGRYGEIDIVAQTDDGLSIIEVKTRGQTKFGYPEMAVNQVKLNKLQLAAQAFMLAHPQFGSCCRLEVVALIIDETGQIKDFKHYRDVC